MLQINRISHFFPKKNRPALKEVSFTVEKGQVFGLLGPNGAGKTTLLRVIATMITPSEGDAIICGYDLRRSPAQIRRIIGLCSDNQRSFYYRLTGYQNLEFFGGMAGISPQLLRRRIDNLLELFSLSESRDLYFMRYSQGMKKKLAFARSLLHDPQVYLLDEPTAGIDPDSVVMIRNLISDLCRNGKTVLLTTHNIEEANKLSDKIGILKQGELITNDSPMNLKKLLQRRRVIIETGNILTSGKNKTNDIINLVEKLRSLNEEYIIHHEGQILTIDLMSTASVAPLLEFMLQQKIHIERFSEQEPTLEDVFLHITHEE